MVLNFPGFRTCYKGERYIIGEKIVVDGGPYDGIYGILAEIRSDEDSELGIGNADFYFKLFAPLYDEDIRAFEQRYSGWCNEPKKLENIPMEKVRISIDGVKFLREDIVAHKVATFFVQEKWVIDGEGGTDIQVFLDRNLAEYYYLEQIYRGKEEGFIKKWQKEPGFYEEVGLNTYKCGDKWSRSANYYEVELCDDEIEIGDEALECIGQQYIGAKLRNTFASLVKDWKVSSDLTDRQIWELVKNPAVPGLILSQLKNSKAVEQAYREAVSEVGLELLKDYRKRKRLPLFPNTVDDKL